MPAPGPDALKLLLVPVVTNCISSRTCLVESVQRIENFEKRTELLSYEKL
jgi:hypothetical protein